MVTQDLGQCTHLEPVRAGLDPTLRCVSKARGLNSKGEPWCGRHLAGERRRLAPKPLSPTAKAERDRCAAIVRAAILVAGVNSRDAQLFARILRQIERGPHAPWCPVKYREPCKCGIPDVER